MDSSRSKRRPYYLLYAQLYTNNTEILAYILLHFYRHRCQMRPPLFRGIVHDSVVKSQPSAAEQAIVRGGDGQFKLPESCTYGLRQYRATRLQCHHHTVRLDGPTGRQAAHIIAP